MGWEVLHRGDVTAQGLDGVVLGEHLPGQRLNPHRGSVERLEGAGITWVRECVLQLQPKLGDRLVDGEAVLPQLGGASEQV
jgi:hypothetical protein